MNIRKLLHLMESLKSLLVYIYIYIYIYLIEQYRHFLSTYFCLYLFHLLYRFYDIRWELVNKSSKINWFFSTFGLILDHHQGCVYCKSYMAFVCTLLLYKNWVFFVSRFCVLIISLQCVICLFTRSRLYSNVLLYWWVARSWSLKYVYLGRISSLIHILSNNIVNLSIYLSIYLSI